MADTLPSILVTGIPSPNDGLLSKGSVDGSKDDRIKPSSSNDCEYSSKTPLTSGKSFPTKLIRTISGSNGGSNQESPAIDPLSQHIFQRIHPDGSNIQRARLNEPETPESMSQPSPARVISPPIITRADTVDSSKDKKKGVSFLSRFIGSKKKDAIPDAKGDGFGPDDNQTEGVDADVFQQPIGFIPKFPAPPKYIKVRSRGKKQQEFNRVFLAQELRGRTDVEIAQAGGPLVKDATLNPSERTKDELAIWAIEFSKDGRYLAAGGYDRIVRVWAVIATGEDRRAHETEEEAANEDGAQTRLSAPVFKSKPIYEYEGHTASILDLSWSKNNFLLSSSMDKTVRLWHTSRIECLCCFKHTDFVTSIQFHPRDDRFFLAGSLDSKLRLWSIPDRSVACWSQLSDLVTAVAFSPDGKTSIAGCLGGSCQFYNTEGMKFLTSMNIKSAHGKNAKGSKVTGIEAVSYPPGDLNGEVKLIITTNDSRVRVYNLRDKSLELKLKGHENQYSQVRASLSDTFIICGSEDRKVYIWSTSPPEKDKDKWPLEMFEAHSAIVTAAILAPIKTRQLLQASGDPLFDLCNPPPVTLISRTESRSSSSPPTEIIPNNDLGAQSTPVATDFKYVKPEESPAYLARSSHPNGNIIVSADYMGRIKVFRQDCGWKKRLKIDTWDPSSTFSKKMMHRTSSIATKNSKSSRRDSLNHPSSDRILSWRQSIERNNTSNDGFPSPRLTSYRSASPRLSQSRTNRSSKNALSSTYTNTPSISTLSNPPSLHKSSIDSTGQIAQGYDGTLEKWDRDTNPLMLRGDASYLFWNKDTYAEQARNAHNLQRRRTRDNQAASGRTSADGGSDDASLAPRPEVSKRESDVSVLSSNSDAEKDGEVKCESCGKGNFTARMRGGERALECVGCGTLA